MATIIRKCIIDGQEIKAVANVEVKADGTSPLTVVITLLPERVRTYSVPPPHRSCIEIFTEDKDVL